MVSGVSTVESFGLNIIGTTKFLHERLEQSSHSAESEFSESESKPLSAVLGEETQLNINPDPEISRSYAVETKGLVR